MNPYPWQAATLPFPLIRLVKDATPDGHWISQLYP